MSLVFRNYSLDTWVPNFMSLVFKLHVAMSLTSSFIFLTFRFMSSTSLFSCLVPNVFHVFIYLALASCLPSWTSNSSMLSNAGTRLKMKNWDFIHSLKSTLGISWEWHDKCVKEWWWRHKSNSIYRNPNLDEIKINKYDFQWKP